MKKIWICLLFASSSLVLFAQSDEDKRALELRKAQEKVKNNSRVVLTLETDILVLHENLVNSNVVPEETIASSEKGKAIIEKVKNEHLRGTNEALLSAQGKKGAERNADVGKAHDGLVKTVSSLGELKSLAEKKADVARIKAKMKAVVSDLKVANKKLQENVEKELAGEKVDQEKKDQLSDDHKKLASDIKDLKEELKKALKEESSPEEKKDEEALNANLEKSKAEEKAKDISDKIESDKLADALKEQRELLKNLEKAEENFNKQNEDKSDVAQNQDESDKSEKHNEEMDQLQNDLEKQNKDLDELSENADPNTDMKKSEKFNELWEKQNELKNRLTQLKKDEMNPEAKKNLEKAEDLVKQSQDELEKGNLEDALDKNEQAKNELAEAQKKSNPDKNKQKKNKKGEKEKEKEQNNNEKGEPMMAEVDLDFKEGEPGVYDPNKEESPKFRDNIEKLGEMPELVEVWGDKSGDKNKSVLLQTIHQKAPKEHEELSKEYFEALASISQR